MEEILKEIDSWFFLQINLAEYLEIAYVGHRIWSNVLWMELKASKDIPEEL